MADPNIYLDLELFLDPPITDPVALKNDLTERISTWNKRVNASPKYKTMAFRANECLKNGLSNLVKQAEEARNRVRDELRNEITELKKAGDIDDAGLSHLTNKYKAFFSEATIRREVDGAVQSPSPNIPVFVAPICPPSLLCDKPVTFGEIQKIRDDLLCVEKGKHCNLYDLLGLPRSSSRQALFEKATSEAGRIRRLPKSNPDADPLNRLSGYCLKVFKDDMFRQGYDIALKRQPFDDLCEKKFKLWAIKKEVSWANYQEAIQETCALGFSKDESAWLVYDFFCQTKQCPHPKPVPTVRI